MQDVFFLWMKLKLKTEYSKFHAYLVGFVFEINTWIDRSQVGPREDSFGSANKERKRPRVSKQVCMKVQSRQF